jgi:hypothetical protein
MNRKKPAHQPVPDEADVTDGLLAIALALNRIADALEAENKLTAAAKADQ